MSFAADGSISHVPSSWQSYSAAAVAFTVVHVCNYVPWQMTQTANNNLAVGLLETECSTSKKDSFFKQSSYSLSVPVAVIAVVADGALWVELGAEILCPPENGRHHAICRRVSTSGPPDSRITCSSKTLPNLGLLCLQHSRATSLGPANQHHAAGIAKKVPTSGVLSAVGQNAFQLAACAGQIPGSDGRHPSSLCRLASPILSPATRLDSSILHRLAALQVGQPSRKLRCTDATPSSRRLHSYHHQ